MTGMRSRHTSNEPRLTRREWTAVLGAAPLATPFALQAAQTAATPEPIAPTSLEKAVADVRQVSDRLSKLEVPMNVEPAFSFKA